MEVKGNPGKAGVSPWWVLGGVGVALLQLLAVVCLNERLPEPRPLDAPREQFSATRAYQHLVDLTDLGPRVAGSYENEVLAVRVATQALSRIAQELGAHHALDVDVFRLDGNYSITFLDGMSTAYRSVVGVVARLRGTGARPTTAALLNCHLDSVPDSPGAHDDALGCAVALETLRALGAASRPHRHDTLLLLNGAEENIMQGSHAFLTQHPWAKWARTFVNIEACGAGGRELLFRATHDYWLLQEYARRAPYPFLASLAQELFEWGVVPADTDYRIFAQHNLSGVDLAWVAEGYAYHTSLDDASRVTLGGLQRTGDNVQQLMEGILVQRSLELSAVEDRVAPLYFDVLGTYSVVLSGAQAAGGAVVLLAGAAILTYYDVPPHFRSSRGVWVALVWRTAGRLTASALAGTVAAATSGTVLALLDARMLAHSRPALLLLQAATPAVVVSWCVFRWLHGGERLRALVTSQRAWLCACACRVVSAVCVCAALVCRLRAGILAATWLLGWCLDSTGTGAALVPALYWCGAARDLVSFLLPCAARAAPHTHPDIIVMAVVGFCAIVAVSWLLPTVLAADNMDKLVGAMSAVYMCGMAWCVVYSAVVGRGAPYSPGRPQRQFALHTRTGDVWLPDIDVNSHTTQELLFPLGALRETNCSELFCGAPYFLPALSLIPHGHWARAAPPATTEGATIHVHLTRDQPDTHVARLNVTVQGEKHIVIIVSPIEGGEVTQFGPVSGPAEGPTWGPRRTYMLTLFDARPRAHRAPWHIPIYIQVPHPVAPESPVASLSVSGHCMSGKRARSPVLQDAWSRAPAWLAMSGWSVDLHHFHL